MAQKRRKERMMKRRQRRITALCIAGGIGAMLLSLVICLLLFLIALAQGRDLLDMLLAANALADFLLGAG